MKKLQEIFEKDGLKGLGKILLDESVEISVIELRWVLGVLIDSMMSYEYNHKDVTIDLLKDLEEIKEIKERH